MKVLNFDFEVDKFEVKGNLEGENTIYPNYAYTLIPPTDNSPCIFKMTVHQEVVGDVSGKITFDTHSKTEIDNQNSIPTVDFLYQLVLSTCRSSSIEFGKEIIKNTKVEPILISPPTLAQCQEVLQQNITRAFPVN